MFAIDKYTGLLKLSFKSQWMYRGDYLLSALINALYPFIMVFLWSAIYASSKTTMIGNLTLFNIYSYFFVASALGPIFYSGIDWYLQSDIKNGRIGISFTRPMRYIVYPIMNDVSSVMVDIIIFTIPILIFVIIFAHLAITPLILLVFFLEVLTTYIVAALLAICIGTLAIYVTNINGIISFKYAIIGLLAGLLVPLSLFPPDIRALLLLSPFQFNYYAISVFIGTVSVASAINSLELALVWISALSILAYTSWYFAKRHINVVGV